MILMSLVDTPERWSSRPGWASVKSTITRKKRQYMAFYRTRRWRDVLLSLKVVWIPAKRLTFWYLKNWVLHWRTSAVWCHGQPITCDSDLMKRWLWLSPFRWFADFFLVHKLYLVLIFYFLDKLDRYAGLHTRKIIHNGAIPGNICVASCPSNTSDSSTLYLFNFVYSFISDYDNNQLDCDEILPGSNRFGSALGRPFS